MTFISGVVALLHQENDKSEEEVSQALWESSVQVRALGVVVVVLNDLRVFKKEYLSTVWNKNRNLQNHVHLLLLSKAKNMIQSP